MPTEQRIETLASRLDKLYEFEREPVRLNKLQKGRHFAALFAGEHVAATEFVIGAMFVQHGIAARDLVIGLMIGNLLAVCSWAFICAPIAVEVRLTLYWHLRRIIGPGLTVLYNIVNAVLYCALAAAMIGVSASAVGLSFQSFGWEFKHPALSDVYPNSVGWVVLVCIVGSVVVTLAILGFTKLAQFSAVCSPWMFLVFVAGALATLPRLGEFHSLSELWTIAETRIWNGRPASGVEKLGLWHVIFFAWFCNLAMHVGLSDLAIFRYARHWYYGFYSAFGMYLGHFLAWLCAGVMGAAIGEELNPGRMATEAAGLAGVIAVVLAGWTTANPTIYRAGLALQIVTPNWARWKITLVAGGVTTVIACFPVIFMRLLGFVAIYGLALMPIGAVVLAEHWLFRRIGLQRYWVEQRRLPINIPALITWVGTLVLCSAMGYLDRIGLSNVHLYFRWLPGWFIAAGLYTGLCLAWSATRESAGEHTTPDRLPGESAPAGSHGETQRAPRGLVFWVSGTVAVMSLVMCLVLPLQVFLGGSEETAYLANMAGYKRWLLAFTILYFVSAVIWTAERETATSGTR